VVIEDFPYSGVDSEVVLTWSFLKVSSGMHLI
jgi:hypothetical protein